MSIYVDHASLKHKLKKLKDVLISGPVDNEVLTYEAASKKWKNKSPAGGVVHKYNYFEETTDILTNSTSFVAMTGYFAVPVTINKRWEMQFGCGVRGGTAGISALVAVVRSLTSGGSPTFAIAGGAVWIGVTAQSFNIPLIATDIAGWTGTMNFQVWWCSPSGYYIYNDGTNPLYRRRLRVLQFLDL